MGESWSALEKHGSSWSSWSIVCQKLVKMSQKLVNLVALCSGLSTAGDETVTWENCLRTYDTSSTPDTSVWLGKTPYCF